MFTRVYVLRVAPPSYGTLWKFPLLTFHAHRNVFRPFHSSLSVEGHRFFYSPLNGRGSPLYTWAVFFTLTHRLYQPMCKRSTAALGCGFIRLVYLPTSYTLAGVLPAPAFRLSSETCICAPVGVEPTPNTFLVPSVRWCFARYPTIACIPTDCMPVSTLCSLYDLLSLPHRTSRNLCFTLHSQPLPLPCCQLRTVPLRLMSVLCRSIVTLCISTAMPHVTLALIHIASLRLRRAQQYKAIAPQHPS